MDLRLLGCILTLPWEPTEPGYYQDGQFGIRIENILIVQDSPPHPGFLKFEHVTYFPLDRNLINPDLLDVEEKKWVDAYHAECWDKLSGMLSEGSEEKAWLRRETLPL